MRHTDVILRFLDSLGRVSDGQFYLGLFHSMPRERFAVLAVDAEIVREALDALVLDLRYLVQLELYPTIYFGLLDTTDADEHAGRAAEALGQAGVETVRLDAAAVDLPSQIQAAVHRGALPLVAISEGQSAEERFDLLAAVLTGLQTRKVIFVHPEGRLGHSREDRISVVNLTTDYDRLIAGNLLAPDQVDLLRQVRRLLQDRLEHRILAAVASPLNLLKELFTVKGGGTLIKRGSVIERHDDLANVERERLEQLLESGFGKRLVPGFLDQPFGRLYLEETYRGAAITVPTPYGSYLTKFAVETLAQGEGLGRDLWQLVADDHPRLFWRCRPTNTILPFYEKVCGGTARFEQWHVFWTGLPLENLSGAITWALEHAEDFLTA